MLHFKIPAPRWVWHHDDFGSLMLGRIQLAQVTRISSYGHWYWTLFFCKEGERISYSNAMRDIAVQTAEDHAKKVLEG